MGNMIITVSVAIFFVIGAGSSLAKDSSSKPIDSTAAKSGMSQSSDVRLLDVNVKNVSMKCGIRENGHRITIWATNTENVIKHCTAICNYKSNLGNGRLSASGDVSANAKEEVFQSRFSSTETYSNPSGSGTCE